VLIDYFTTVAQIINFLVLVFLLRHFLYKPIINSMDERELKIASRLKDADERRKKAQQEEEAIRKVELDLAAKREELMAKATVDAEAARADLMKKARDEVDKSKGDWYEALERQKEAFLVDIRLQAGRGVYAVIRRALGDLANDELERRIIDTFLKRLEIMDELDKKKLKEIYEKPDKKIIVRSTFEIPAKMRQKLQDALRKQVGAEIEIQYHAAPDLISGIELCTSDMKIAWSIDSYLDDLVADLSHTLDQRIAEEKEG
jgi:F-type H+-transporting ATPase subunit b